MYFLWLGSYCHRISQFNVYFDLCFIGMEDNTQKTLSIRNLVPEEIYDEGLATPMELTKDESSQDMNIQMKLNLKYPIVRRGNGSKVTFRMIRHETTLKAGWCAHQIQRGSKNGVIFFNHLIQLVVKYLGRSLKLLFKNQA